jgi:hypothetical protein
MTLLTENRSKQTTNDTPEGGALKSPNNSIKTLYRTAKTSKTYEISIKVNIKIFFVHVNRIYSEKIDKI